MRQDIRRLMRVSDMRYLYKNEPANWLKLLNLTKKEGGLKDCKFALVILFLNCYNKHILNEEFEIITY